MKRTLFALALILGISMVAGAVQAEQPIVSDADLCLPDIGAEPADTAVPMAELRYYTLDVEASVAAGDFLTVKNCRSMVVQTSGTFTATMKLEVSMEASGTNTFQVESDVTAAGKTVIDDVAYARRLRVNTTAYTSGTAVMTLQCLWDADMEGSTLSLSEGPVDWDAPDVAMSVNADLL